MKITFRVHAIQRMFERKISVEDVRSVLENGEAIETYADDLPYPSRLVLGWRKNRPIHVVVAENSSVDEMIVITVYEPDQLQWEADFRSRRKP
jgi:hypothetical protein